MKKQAKMKSAVITSIIAMLLSVAMLFGTTFAWFTDSVTNTNNIIKTGNLDVELYHTSNNLTEEKVKGATKLFVDENGGQILWEPGAESIEAFRIANEGSLALKYEFRVKAIAKTANEKDKTLADKLTIKVEGDASYEAVFSEGYVVENNLHANEEANYKVTISWKQGADDNQYADLKLVVGIELVATQYSFEKDGNGNSFDSLAEYPNVSPYVEKDSSNTEATVLETKGENAVKAEVPTGIINALPTEVTQIAIVHTEPIKKADELYFEAIELIDQNGDVIDLEALGVNEEVTVTLPAQKVFEEKETVAIYHDGKFVVSTTVGANGVIAYSTKHFSEVLVKPISKWEGGIDTSWYNPEAPKTEYTFTTAEQIGGLAELCSGDTTFDGVTFTLASDIDLYCEDTSATADGDPVTFRPIGDHSKNGTFEGTFDGNGHTIFNLYQNGWDLGYMWGVYGSYGLFGNVNNATIKNLTIEGSESYIEGGDTSFVAGSATGICVFENITIKNSISATYNNGNGGIIGWSGAGNYTFKDITIAEDCVLAGLWGSFDSSIGGIVGQAEPGATYNFENVDIACRIDAYNDCTASYDYYNYRMCGMLIGRCAKTTTIDGANYPDTSKYNITCTNVTVTYGEWANYHYCRAEGARAKRVEAGYSYDGIAADYDHSVCTVHDMELIPFDQVIGGDQYAVKGLKTYDGVEVIYNNK